MPVFLNIRDYYNIEGNDRAWNDLLVKPSKLAIDLLDKMRIHRNEMWFAMDDYAMPPENYEVFDNKYYKYLNEYNKLSNSIIDNIKKFIIKRKIAKFNDIEGGTATSTREIEKILERDGSDINIIFRNIKDYGKLEKGAYIYNLPSSDVYVVTNPNQIKSATDNIGTFDSNNPDIRYRVVSTTLKDSQNVESNKYLNRSMRSNLNTQWGTLSKEELEYLNRKGITKEIFDKLSKIERANLLECVGI